MYHYLVKVPSVSEELTSMDTIIARVRYFNDRQSYLLFDSGDENEKQTKILRQCLPSLILWRCSKAAA